MIERASVLKETCVYGLENKANGLISLNCSKMSEKGKGILLDLMMY